MDISIVTANGMADNSNGKPSSTMSHLPAARVSNGAKIEIPWKTQAFKDEILKTGLAELIGTAMLVFLGCMGCVGSLGTTPTPLQIALVFGFVVMIIIQSIGHISDAHINPAVTVGSIVLGKKTLLVGSVYIVAQCVGAFLGYGLLKVVTPHEFLFGTDGQNGTETFCITQLHKDIPAIQGLLGETIATAVLMFMTCAAWDVRNEKNSDSSPIKFGLMVAALCMALAPYTGCSMNPARSLGPAIWNNYWRQHWIFWSGPIGGALLASLVYRSLFSVKTSTPTDVCSCQKTEI